MAPRKASLPRASHCLGALPSRVRHCKRDSLSVLVPGLSQVSGRPASAAATVPAPVYQLSVAVPAQ